MTTKTFNVLLLGQTGVGKSTFINACANYAKYDSFESALKSEFTCLIPTKFSTTDCDDKQHTITFGADENETLETGKSATQRCKSYNFRTSLGTIRLIDTPGIGDTRCVEQDSKNFEDLFMFLSQIEEVHRICILIDSNSCRRTTVFDYCIKQLFAHLSKTAKNNICFVFTKARGTGFSIGEALQMIKEVLKEVATSPPFVQIPVSKENMFCVDNGSFTYVLAVKNGVKYEDDAYDDYKRCWNKSVAEYSRFFEYVFSCSDPHKVVDTVSVYKARNLIARLTSPLKDVAQLIQDSIALCKHQEGQINFYQDDIEQLKKNLFIPKMKASVDTLPHPRTICVSSECSDLIQVGSIQRYDYKKMCHAHCYLTGVEAETINNSALLHCAAMNGTTCKECGCSYLKHMHVYYKLTVELIQVEDETQKSRIQNKSQAVAASKAKIEQLRKEQQDLRKEEDCILKCSAKFAHFLKRNAITPFNDKFEEYIKQAIENAEAGGKRGLNTRDMIQNLQNTLKKYQQERNVFEKALTINIADQLLSPQNIENCIQELYSLKIYGKLIKDAVEKQNRARNSEIYHHKQVEYTTSDQGQLFADQRLKQRPVLARPRSSWLWRNPRSAFFN